MVFRFRELDSYLFIYGKMSKEQIRFGLIFLCTKNRMVKVLKKYNTDIEKIWFLMDNSIMVIGFLINDF